MTKVLVEQAVQVGYEGAVFQVVVDGEGRGCLRARAWTDGLSLADLGRISVAKWQTMVMGYDAGATRIKNGGGSTCAFCERFYEKMKGPLWCVGCPIHAYTKEPDCWGTPYYDYVREMDNPESTPETLKAAAQEELEFVEAVVEWMTESDYQLEEDDDIPF